MKMLEELRNEVQGLFPEAKMIIDEAETSIDSSFLNIQIGKREFIVEYRTNEGFGLSDLVDVVHSEGPEHVSLTLEGVLGQLLALVAIETKT